MLQSQRQFFTQFIFKKVIGQGTFGTVKKCIWNQTGHLCAVKTIDNVNMISLQKIQEEVQIMKTLNSDYSLQLIDQFYDRKNSSYILVMPYCKLGSLQKRIQDDWTIHEILLFFAQIVQGFIDLSQHQIMHLDLKPQNILLKNVGEYLLCDFGCSRVHQSFNQSANFLKMSASKGLGTVDYAAPQIVKQNNANKYSDIWSMGIILYRMIYHKLPFTNNEKFTFGAYKTTFDGHKPEFQPLVDLVRKMISVKGRPTWVQCKQRIYQILDISNYVIIVTSLQDYVEYIKNVAVLATSFCYLLERVSKVFESLKIDIKTIQKQFLTYAEQLSFSPFESNEFYFFECTRSRMTIDDKARLLSINKQIRNILQQRQIVYKKRSLTNTYNVADQKEKPNKQESNSYQKKQCLIKQSCSLLQKIYSLNESYQKKLKQTPEYQFNKTLRIIQFVCGKISSLVNVKNQKDFFSYTNKKHFKTIVGFVLLA